MTKKVSLFFVFFIIAVLTEILFMRLFNNVTVNKTPIVIHNTQIQHPQIADDTVAEVEVEKLQAKEVVMENETTTDSLLEQENNITKEETSKPFSFVVIADAESYKTPSRQNDIFEHMLAKTASYKPDFALFTGDLLTFETPNKTLLSNVKKKIEKYYDNYYISVGKHDVECGIKCVDTWNKVFYDKEPIAGKKRKLYHSFDYENTHFVLLSSDYPIKHSIDDKQLKWLDADLSNTDTDHIIVAVHVPPVNFFKESAKKCHDMTCSEPQRTKLMNILKKHHVDLVISGHEHAFDHKIVDGIDFVLAGNSGNGKRYKNSTWEDSFSLINVTKYGINLKALGADGHLIRDIKIK